MPYTFPPIRITMRPSPTQEGKITVEASVGIKAGMLEHADDIADALERVAKFLEPLSGQDVPPPAETKPQRVH